MEKIGRFSPPGLSSEAASGVPRTEVLMGWFGSAVLRSIGHEQAVDIALLSRAIERCAIMFDCIDRAAASPIFRFRAIKDADNALSIEQQLRPALKDAMLFNDLSLTKVIMMSCTEPFPRPVWMPSATYEAALSASYVKCFTTTVSARSELDGWNALLDFVRSGIRLHMSPIAPHRLFGSAVTESMSRDLTAALLEIHARDIAMALIGEDRDRCTRGYAVLAAHTPYAIPIGQPSDSARANPWLVITA